LAGLIRFIGYLLILFSAAVIGMVLFCYGFFHKHLGSFWYWGNSLTFGYPASRIGILHQASLLLVIGIGVGFQETYPGLIPIFRYSLILLFALTIPIAIFDYRIHRGNFQRIERVPTTPEKHTDLPE
jgi:hypothetical protein